MQKRYAQLASRVPSDAKTLRTQGPNRHFRCLDFKMSIYRLTLIFPDISPTTGYIAMDQACNQLLRAFGYFPAAADCAKQSNFGLQDPISLHLSSANQPLLDHPPTHPIFTSGFHIRLVQLKVTLLQRHDPQSERFPKRMVYLLQVVESYLLTVASTCLSPSPLSRWGDPQFRLTHQHQARSQKSGFWEDPPEFEAQSPPPQLVFHISISNFIC